MGVWIAAAIVLIRAVLPLGVRVRCNSAGLILRVISCAL